MFCAMQCSPRQGDFITADVTNTTARYKLRMHDDLAKLLWLGCKYDEDPLEQKRYTDLDNYGLVELITLL